MNNLFDGWRSLGKGKPSKSNSTVELDLIYLSKTAEGWKKNIENLLPKNIKIQHGCTGKNKWIGVCEAKFDGHIDVENSIPKSSLPKTKSPGMIILIGQQHMKHGEEYDIEPYYSDSRVKYITVAGFPSDTYRAKRAIIALIDDLPNTDKNTYDEQIATERKEARIDESYHRSECGSNIVGDITKSTDERIAIEGKEARIDESYHRSECGSDFVEDITKSTDSKHDNRKKPLSLDKTTDDCHSAERDDVKQSLLEFLESILNQNFSQTHSNFPSSSLSSQIKGTSNTAKKQSPIGQQVHEFSFTFEESIHWVVYDVQSVTKLITVHKDKNLDETAHVIMEKDGIDENCVVNSLALRDIKRFVQELDEINVITHDLDERTRGFLWSFLDSKLGRVKVTFLESGAIPQCPWILVYPEKHDQADENFKELTKGLKCMIMTIHGERDSPEEVKIRNSQTDTPMIHLLYRDSMIDDRYYLNQRAKAEIHRLLKKFRTDANTGEVEEKETKDNSVVAVPKADTCMPSPPCKRRVHIKYLSNLPRKAFSDFADKYITRIQPIWVKGEELVEKGSLCVVVCFTLARLLDDISAVIKITQQDCINMLVVIQNCREGISPGPMLNHNPDSCFTNFTNILYGDGECYECDINSEAKAKIQSFIDSN